MAERLKKPHAIMISVPYQGHLNPFVNLALKLASNGFTITFVHLEYIHHKLSKAHLHGNSTTEEVDFFSEARRSGLDVRYTTISDGVPLEFDRFTRFEEYWKMILHGFRGRVDEFVGKMMKSDPDGAHFLVADTVYSWPAAIADKYKLVNVSLWTQPALVFSLLYHWNLLEKMDIFHVKEINYIPGIDSINTKDLASVFKESGLSTVLVKASRLAFEGVKKADFILHNTVNELEPQTLSALNKYQPNYAIGPINFFKNLPTNTVSKSLWSESDCTGWLESKPPASVLYVSFGSFVHVDKQRIEEIAYGLLLSEVHFIWVVRQGMMRDGDMDVFPGGFLDEVKDKALIVHWCDQIRVLSHPAVGGFLTHNGWNSTVESIWCGVPMICHPFAYDQITNRKLVVDDWRVGINLCDGAFVDRKEVAEKIKGFVLAGMRREVRKVTTIMHKALEIDGSSERSFHQFVKDLEAKIYAKTSSVG